MKEENKHCYNCRWYRPLYIKQYNCFERQNRGTCKGKTVVEKVYVCEKWEYNTDFNRRINKEFTRRAVIKSLDETIKNLTEIGQILKENRENDY